MSENPTPAPTSALVDERLAAWSKAELEGDAATLDELLHPDFVGVGPYGFVLDREQWLARFANGLHYDAFEFTRLAQPRPVDGVSIVIGTQSQQGSYNGQPADGVFRTSVVLVGPQASIAHLQISLGSPPGMAS
jgi:hypothetical protein